MDRDTLDSMQLVCRFVRDFIATLDRRTALLALRWMDRVDIGKVMRCAELPSLLVWVVYLGGMKRGS